MSERKVLNKYFPPDFDPSKIPRRHLPKNSQQVVRLMAPFSMRCTTCGEYIYKGKKFNARKETVEGETYYGIKIFRFYIKCTLCSAEITFKTDPKNTDYEAEHGASRNFEPWRDEKAEEEDRIARMEEEENNPMKALENKTSDSKREMDILDALQDIRQRNARHERVTADGLEGVFEKTVEVVDPEEEKRRAEEEEDEKLVNAVFKKEHHWPAGATSAAIPSTSAVKDEGAGGDDGSDGESNPDTPATSIFSAPVSVTAVKRKATAAPGTASLPKAMDIPKSAQPPPKKRKSDLANVLGIKLVKGKGKAKA